VRLSLPGPNGPYTIYEPKVKERGGRVLAGFAGLTQVNLLVPQLAAGDHAVVVTVGGVESNSVLAAIGP
jgi:hypothetical protein